MSEQELIYAELLTIAKALHRDHYAEVTQWEPLESVRGIVSQIDNMTAGLPRTTWVSVDERLPDGPPRNPAVVLIEDQLHGSTIGNAKAIIGHGGFVTHWLDNLPPIPTGKDQ